MSKTIENIEKLHGFNESSLQKTQDPPIEINDDEDYLPVGSHLLPHDFRQLLICWNRDMFEKVGCWYSKEMKEIYRKAYPTAWAAFRVEFLSFKKLYSDNIAALKAYQKEYKND